MRRLVLTVSLLAAVSSVTAQNKCVVDGKTVYQQAPCASGAVPAAIYQDAQGATPTGPKAQGVELCRQAMPKIHDFKDPYSLKFEGVRGPKAVAVRIAGQVMLAQQYMVLINAKNSYGAYAGTRPFACYLTPDYQRVLHNVTEVVQ